MNDLLYGALDIPEIDRKKALSEIKNLTLFKYWFWDSYRATTMLPVMTLNGLPENVSHYTEGISTGDFAWTSYAPPTLREYCEKYILPITGNTRIMVLATKPGQENKEHIDCDPASFGLLQHKLRFVLQGRTDSLYFITKNGERVHIPNTSKPFIMDGSWPHGMINNFELVKYTVAFGSPWQGNHEYNQLTDALYKSNYELPENYPTYFDQSKPDGS